MLLSGGLSSISQLPQPSMGLLPAVHSTSPINVEAALPSVSTAGELYRNVTGAPITIPAQGNFPARSIKNGAYFSSNGTAFYKVRNKPGLTRQVTSLIDGVFQCANPHGLVNGQTIRLYGFINATTTFAGERPLASFSDDGSYYFIVNASGNSFMIGNEDGVFTDASSGGGTGGWVHTQESSSYYPEAFERTIYTFPFSLQSLPIGERFALSRLFSFRSISAQSACVWSVIIEFGERVDDVGPGSVGPNLQSYSYLPPAVEQQVVITDVITDHPLGIEFSRTAEGVSGSRLIYSRSPALIPGTLPLGDDFSMRVRLSQFDIENQIADPSGYVAFNVAPNPKYKDNLS